MLTTATTITLECDHGPALCLRQPTVIRAESRFDCINQARAAGWFIPGTTGLLCPTHNAERIAAGIEGERLASSR